MQIFIHKNTHFRPNLPSYWNSCFHKPIHNSDTSKLRRLMKIVGDTKDLTFFFVTATSRHMNLSLLLHQARLSSTAIVNMSWTTVPFMIAVYTWSISARATNWPITLDHIMRMWFPCMYVWYKPPEGLAELIIRIRETLSIVGRWFFIVIKGRLSRALLSLGMLVGLDSCLQTCGSAAWGLVGAGYVGVCISFFVSMFFQPGTGRSFTLYWRWS